MELSSTLASSAWGSREGEPHLVSVIIPTFNRESLLADAMDSVWHQTYRPIELLIVDDGSTDDTAKLVDNWAKEHQDETFTLKYLSQSNQGVSAARNHGLRESRGEFIQFLDSDDILAPEKLSRCVAVIEKSGASYAYAISAFLNAAGELDRTTPGVRFNASANRMPFVTLALWDVNSPLYRRRVCVDIGPWNETLIGAEDQEYHARVKLRFGRGAFIGEVMDYVRQHNHGKATSAKTTEQSLRYARSVNSAYERIAGLMVASSITDGVEWNYLARIFIANAFRLVFCGDERTANQAIRRAGQIAVGPQKWCYIVLAWACKQFSAQRVLRIVRTVVRQGRLRSSRQI
jgi:glycosyltransferase involved in cell wall biosynthesis